MTMAAGRREAMAAALGAALVLPFLVQTLRYGAYADPLLLADCAGLLALGACVFAVCARMTGWLPRAASRRAVEALGIVAFVVVMARTLGVGALPFA